MGIPHSKVAKLISVPFHVIERQRSNERKETAGIKKPSKKLDISKSLFEQHWFPTRKKHSNIQTEQKNER
jgi:hypothetical protein